MTGKRTGTLLRLFSGRRAGATLMVCGVALAGLAALLVMGMARQSQHAAGQGVRQVYVVMATKEIAEFTPIRADAVAVKPFPAAFVPPGTVSTVDEVVGKFASTRLVRDQLVLSSQISAAKRSSNLSATIPPGKVAFWMPMPDLLAQSGGLQPGDHLDILLSISLSASQGGQGKGITTQTTLQNVEVFFVGSANADVVSSAAAVGPSVSQSAAGRAATKVVVFLVDHQDAVLTKFIKDSGGTIDLVLRSKDAPGVVQTESVTADTIVERFYFRVPERWSVGR